ncbi:MAG TPA: hypothetical protein PJ988_20490, partial [Anaerolinea sp.]|nr:hypothetical protein [Anaerolinea sp.]
MDKPFVLDALKDGKVSVEGQFLSGSNYTFLSEVTHQEQTLKVVYKPVRGEQPLWDFDAGSLAHREAAAYLLSEALGWDLVPPTIYRRRAPLGPGSLQLYVEHDPHHHFFTFTYEEKQRLRPVAVFDLISNNADRKGGHILIDEHQHIWLIDQGLCFHVDDKLRTVVWDFAGEPLPGEILADLETLVRSLGQGEPRLGERDEDIGP